VKLGGVLALPEKPAIGTPNPLQANVAAWRFDEDGSQPLDRPVFPQLGLIVYTERLVQVGRRGGMPCQLSPTYRASL